MDKQSVLNKWERAFLHKLWLKEVLCASLRGWDPHTTEHSHRLNSAKRALSHTQVFERSLLISRSGFSSGGLLFIVLLLLRLVQLPLLLALDGNWEGSVVVASAVVADTGVPPELVSEEATQQHVGVVELVIVAYPAADESPGGLDSRVSREKRSLCWFATYAHT